MGGWWCGVLSLWLRVWMPWEELVGEVAAWVWMEGISPVWVGGIPALGASKQQWRRSPALGHLG